MKQTPEQRSNAARRANETRTFNLIRIAEKRLEKMGWRRRHPCVTWDHKDTGRRLDLLRDWT